MSTSRTLGPAEALGAFQVPGHSNWYTIGSGQSRVTIRTQQIRALNLAWALHRTSKIPDGPVVVIGAGAAGLSVAAGLAHFGANVTVLEREAFPLPLQRHCYKRHLHPNVFDWPQPAAENAFAELPLLNWKAGMAREVALSIEAAFDSLVFEYEPRLTLEVGVRDIDPDALGVGMLSFRKGKRMVSVPYGTLIFALGFGVENPFWTGPRGSYWSDDNLDQHGVFPAGRYLVSGVGDGGLIDLLRIVTSGLHQADFARLAPTGRSFARLRDDILQIEADAKLAASDKVGKLMFEAYQRLNGTAVDMVDARLLKSLHSDVHVTLVARGNSPFLSESRPLHRFLLSRLLLTHADLITVLTNCELTDKIVERRGHGAILRHGGEHQFDNVVIRHGTTGSTGQFARVDEAMKTFRPVDIGGSALYEAKEFGGRTFGGGPIAWAGGPSEDDYFDTLQRKCSAVRGIDDGLTDPDAIDDIYYEVRSPQGQKSRRVIKSVDRLVVIKSVDRAVAEADESTSDAEAQKRADWMREAEQHRLEREQRRMPGMAIRPVTHRVEGITLLSGRPGTGKTTFLKLLAKPRLEAHRLDDTRRLPVWVSGALDSFVTDPSQVLSGLVDAAMRSLELAPYSRAASYIHDRLVRGKAVVFLDAVDAWEPESIGAVVRELRKCRVPCVLSARRFSAHISVFDDPDVRRYELLGVSPRSAKLFAELHMGDRDAASAAINSLATIPNSSDWCTNPFLMSLAIRMIRAGASMDSCASTLDLFDWSLSASHLVPENPEEGDRVWALLRGFAQQDLRRDPPSLFFARERVPFNLRQSTQTTGLVSGDRLLEFSHLSIGEYLASRPPIDLEKERLALQAPGAELTWRHQLEILAMAHAGSIDELSAAFAALNSSDSRHMLLSLLLRAIAYGSSSARAFSSGSKKEIVAAVLARLSLPSGRFGERERTLMAAMRRASPLLHGVSLPGSLPEHGEPGAEAWALGADFGVKVNRRPTTSYWWPTIFHQARALLNVDPEEVWARTCGGERSERGEALAALQDEAQRRDLLTLPGDPRFSGALVGIDPSSFLLLGLLSHDDDFARRWVIRSRPDGFWASEGMQDVLGSIIRFDSESSVRAAAVRGLEQGRFVDVLVRALRAVAGPRSSISGGDIALCEALLQKLAFEPSASELIDEFIANGSAWFLSQSTWDDLLQDQGRVEALLRRLESGSAHAREISAARHSAQLFPIIRLLAVRYAKDPEETWRLAACIGALPQNDGPTRNLRIQCLQRDILGNVEQDEQGITSLRRRSIASLVGDHEALDLLRRFLEATDDDEAALEALKAIGRMPAVRSLVWKQAREGGHNAKMQAFEILSEFGEEVPALSDHLKELSTESRAFGDYHRSKLVELLARHHSPDWLLQYIDDVSAEVREVAIAGTINLPGAQSLLRKRVFREGGKSRRLLWKHFATDSSVREELQVRALQDQWEVRRAYFWLSVEDENRSERLKKFLNSATSDSKRYRAIPDLVRALVRDDSALPALRDLISHTEVDVVEALLSAMRLDTELRVRARALLASDTDWVKRFAFYGSAAFRRYFTGDAVAQEIALTQIKAEVEASRGPLLVSILRGYQPAVPMLKDLLENDDPNIVAAAYSALVNEADVQARLVDQLSDEDASTRREAARILSEADRAHEVLAERLNDDDKDTRRRAYESLRRLGRPVPDAARVLMVETDADVRKAALQTLLDRPLDEHLALLRERVANDYAPEIRGLAAQALPAAAPSSTLRASSRVRAAIMEVGTASPLAQYLRAPRPLSETEQSLFDLVVGWTVAKLVSTLPYTTDESEAALSVDAPEALFGEMKLDNLDGDVLVRIAADAADLPRDRNIWPSANLVFAWKIACHLRCSYPRTIVLACADVDYDRLDVPVLAPGEVRCGPTFFGFSLQVVGAV